ncbi:NUDIX hydrolase [Emticicia sp. C21]|uniref:NUDIX domain-containing protein n=1 Tax=Emticicia sp. C21 TaxID=2302915 RepID=UPI000E35172E|nr:NUDIX hydrolase [Emticicia sp. C21]RFS18280.1 NUDIX hydrolase [Emticicia sp. C21]
MINDAQETVKKLYSNKIRIRVCGICIENEQVLMVCHKGVINENDVWLPPGGGMEEGETLTKTLEREFLEETGYHIKVGSFLYKNEFIHPPIHAIELYFSVQILSGKLMKGTDPEVNHDAQIIKDVRWIPVKNREFFTEDVYLAINR